MAANHPAVPVHAFEPNPHTQARLARNLALNPGVALTWHALALSDTEGEAEFFAFEGNDSGLSSLRVPLAGDDTRRHTVLTPVSTLDAQRSRMSHPIGVIKIDVQGHEPAVLRGATDTLSRDRPVVVFEHEDINFNDAREAGEAKQALRDLLTALGYTVFYISRKDPDLLFPVRWDAPLNGDLIALPLARADDGD